MTSQRERAEVFNRLHIKGNPIILFNVWDAGTAKALQDLGAKALATSSMAVAEAYGFTDGETLPIEIALANVERIIASVDLPVTLDFEGGYAETPAQLKANIGRVIEAGAIGVNFEDQIVGGEGLYAIDVQAERIKAVREAAEGASIPLFINARTDIFLKLKPADHKAHHLEEAIERAKAYAQAGASGYFAAGLRNADFIKTLCAESPIPVNILIMPDVPAPKQLAELGVARISYGSGPYWSLMSAFKESARTALSAVE